MKRVIILTVCGIAMCAMCGDFRLGGIINADTAVSVTGAQSSLIAGAVQTTDATYTDTVANAAGALQPSWAATGTVRRAIYADEAARIVQADSNAWITVEHGTNWLYTIGSASNVYVVSVSGEGYNGPAVGSMWTNATHNETSWSWTDNGDATLLASGPEDINNCTVFSTYVMGVDALFMGGVDDTAPAELHAEPGNAVGSLVVDFAPVTNRVQVMTVPGTVIMLTDHNADGAAHPTLPRYGDVSNIVSAATSGFVATNHDGNVSISGTVSATSFSGSGAPLTGVVKPSDILGQGETNLGTGLALTIGSETASYYAAPTGTWSLAVSAGALRYPRDLMVVGTNASVLDSSIVDLRDGLTVATNVYRLTPFSTNSWALSGGSPMGEWELAPYAGSQFYNAGLSLGGVVLAANAATSTSYWVAADVTRWTTVEFIAEMNAGGSPSVSGVFLITSTFGTFSTNLVSFTLGMTSAGTVTKTITLPPVSKIGVPRYTIVLGRSSAHGTTVGGVLRVRKATDAEALRYTTSQ